MSRPRPTLPGLRTIEQPADRPHETADLEALLGRCAARFRWAHAPERYEIAGCWSSRTATLYRCRGLPSGPDVMVKVGTGWRPAEAEALYSELLRLASIVAGGSAQATQPLGWDSVLPAVCTDYVDGIDLLYPLADLDHELWRSSRWTPRSAVAEAGRVLGLYHAAPFPASELAVAQGREELRRLARVMVLPARTRVALSGGPMAASFGDVGPHQLRIATSGDLYVLDPPARPTVAPVYRDLGLFAFELEKAVGTGATGRRRTAQRRAVPTLVESLLTGYAGSGPIDPRRAAERRLVSAFRGWAAAGMASKRLRSGRVGEATRYASRWLREALAARFVFDR